MIFRPALKAETEAVSSTKLQANWRKKKAQERYKSQKKSKDVDGTKVVSEVEDLKMRNEGHVEDGFFTVCCEDGDLGLQIEPWPPASQVWIRKVSKDGWAQKMGIKLGDELLMMQKQPLKIFEVRGGIRLFFSLNKLGSFHLNKKGRIEGTRWPLREKTERL